MGSPFPGMDPYLESPSQWSDFHNRFINDLSDALAERLPRNYFARIEEQVVLLEPEVDRPKRVEPDVLVMRGTGLPIGAVGGSGTAGTVLEPVTLANIESLDAHTETYIEILRLPEREVVSVVELLSPTNKSGEGRGFYLDKRHRLLRQRVHIIELDLIRAGKRLELEDPLPEGDYYAFVSRAERRPMCDVYAWTAHQPLPVIPIPLRAPDPDVKVDLAEVFKTTYRRGQYEHLVDYTQPPPPPSFAEPQADWVRQTALQAVR